MRARETAIAGVWLIENDAHHDERGAFARVWSAVEHEACGLGERPEQVSLSRNTFAGTLRGLHYAAGEDAETKLVRCISGAIFDVAVDIRPGSPSFGRYVGMRLDAERGDALRIAPGIAHGFLTLEAQSDVLYLIDRAYVANAARTLRYDDPQLAIPWPQAVTTISTRDAHAPLLSEIGLVLQGA